MDIGLLNVGLIGAPAVHMAHRRGTWGMASLGTRLFLPPISSLFGALSACVASGSFERACTESGMTGGFLAGALGASALDAFVYANPNDFERRRPERWYGWQILSVDAIGALFGASVYANAVARGSVMDPRFGPEVFFAAGMYAVGAIGAPIVHLFHRQWLRAFGDFSMRLFVPAMWIAASLIGNCAATSGISGCADSSISPGLFLGTVAVAAFDAAGLGWEEAGDSRPTGTAAIAVFPSVTVREGRPHVGLGGVF
ncbi:MAG: hypothetical protein IRZ16_01235 [Myxococcaceae bacterium]|nr:hypothetical protein [Myxococcaceae bacterium]